MSMVSAARGGQSHHFIVLEDQQGMRLDQFLSRQCADYSRTFLQNLIESGQVQLNGAVSTKPGQAIKTGDTVVCSFLPTECPVKRVAGPLPSIEIVFQHEHFLVVNKPAYCMVHAPHVDSPDATLVDWIIAKYQEVRAIGLPERPGIVHRLDRNTSGLLIIARTNEAHKHFSALFKNRALRKMYYAVVQGHPPAQGTINMAIGRDPVSKVKMKTFPHGFRVDAKTRDAVTHYRVIQYLNNAALLEIHPVTGRTHQIRVHCAAIGHPLIGDATYGQRSALIERHALHAAHLVFDFNLEHFSFHAPVPTDIKQLIQQLTPAA